MSQGRILVVRGGAIGDFILTLPVLAALRATFPQTQVELLGYPHIASLAHAGGLAHAVRSIEARSLAGFFAKGGKLDAGLSDFFSGFNLVISYLYDPDEIFRANVGSCTPAQFIQGRHRPDESAHIHATEVFLQALEKLAIFGADTVPRLNIAPNGPMESKRWLAVHPGSGSEKKNWPEASWIELLAILLAGSELDILLVGGEAEGDRLQRIAAALPSNRVHLAQRLPLTELAIRLKCCAAFAGHDSGITHLAAAIGLPCFVLWGESKEAIWRPLGSHVHLLRAENGLSKLSVDEVRVKLNDFLALDKDS